jgi:hypothetical protein
MTTRAINALLQIMHDDSETMSARRRIEAAEHLLDYECPEEVRVECKEFLTSIFEDNEQHVDIRLDALKLARKFEAAKITPRTVRTRGEETDRREKWRRYEIAQRHWKLSLAIMDTPPKGWADDLYSDAYVAPDGCPRGAEPRGHCATRATAPKVLEGRRAEPVLIPTPRAARFH